jgi:hypothetical protein
VGVEWSLSFFHRPRDIAAQEARSKNVCDIKSDRREWEEKPRLRTEGEREKKQMETEPSWRRVGRERGRVGFGEQACGWRSCLRDPGERAPDPTHPIATAALAGSDPAAAAPPAARARASLAVLAASAAPQDGDEAIHVRLCLILPRTCPQARADRRTHARAHKYTHISTKVHCHTTPSCQS